MPAFPRGEFGAPYVVSGAEPPGQPGGGQALEDRAYGQCPAEGGPDPVGQPHGEQGVATQVEEAVVGAHPVRVQAEYVGEQPAQDLLLRGTRGAAPTGRCQCV